MKSVYAGVVVSLLNLAAVPAKAQAPLASGAIEALPRVTEDHPRPFATSLSASGERVSGVALPADLFASDWPPSEHPPFLWASGEGYSLIVPSDSLDRVEIGGETAISADGTVVVGTFTGTHTDPFEAQMQERAFRWTLVDGFTWLAAPEGATSRARAASEDGRVILGDIHPRTPEAQPEASGDGRRVTGMPGRAISPPTRSTRPPRQQVLWRGDSVTVVPPPPGYERVLGRDLSGDGTVVVGTGFASGASGFDRAAFRWTAETGSQLIPGLENYSTSEANAVSADGRVIVGYAFDGSLENLAEAAAFRWSEADGLEWLGTWTARDVSADGSTVVGSYRTALAVLWTPEAGARYARDVFDAGDWWLMSIHAVSADGRIVLGGGEAPNGMETSWRGRIPAK